jgi:hypothetical protein
MNNWVGITHLGISGSRHGGHRILMRADGYNDDPEPAASSNSRKPVAWDS